MSDNGSPAVLPKTEFNKYKIGKVKSTPAIQRDAKTNLTYIKLRKRSSEKVYGCTVFQNHYREDEKLGQGTFGEVYKGIHLETQRQVAMKKIIVSVEKDLFPITAQREITILKRLNHKNIIKLIEMVYDHSPDITNAASSNLHKSFYMILPYMVADLSGVLHNPRINLEMCDIKNMMLQILEGLNYIHCAKFMHRDIKTANILIDHNGVLKLADFGLARLYYGCPPNLKYPGGAGRLQSLSDLELAILISAARVALRAKDGSFNFNLAYAEYEKMIKAINSRIPTVAPTTNVGTGQSTFSIDNTIKLWLKKDVKNVWENLVQLDFFTEKSAVGLRDNATAAFYASNYQFQGTMIPFDLRSYQMQIILQELRRIIPKSNMYYSWTQL
ncbi:Protein kinase domain family protein [Saccharomyces cerevisiae]|nr:Protein kinase domain family protein [Saccharomyces cerevisiae]